MPMAPIQKKLVHKILIKHTLIYRQSNISDGSESGIYPDKLPFL